MVQDWLGVVLGAGGVAFLGALFKGVQMLRDGARAREREAIAGLEKWREDADKRADRAFRELDYMRTLVAYWQARAGAREYQLHLHGITPDPPPPLPMPLVEPLEGERRD